MRPARAGAERAPISSSRASISAMRSGSGPRSSSRSSRRAPCRRRAPFRTASLHRPAPPGPEIRYGGRAARRRHRYRETAGRGSGRAASTCRRRCARQARAYCHRESGRWPRSTGHGRGVRRRGRSGRKSSTSREFREFRRWPVHDHSAPRPASALRQEQSVLRRGGRGRRARGPPVRRPAAEPDQLQRADHVAHLMMQEGAGGRDYAISSPSRVTSRASSVLTGDRAWHSESRKVEKS